MKLKMQGRGGVWQEARKRLLSPVYSEKIKKAVLHDLSNFPQNTKKVMTTMENIINILAEAGSEPCRVEVNQLHDALLHLPAQIYIELYYMMMEDIEGRAYCLMSADKKREK